MKRAQRFQIQKSLFSLCRPSPRDTIAQYPPPTDCATNAEKLCNTPVKSRLRSPPEKTAAPCVVYAHNSAVAAAVAAAVHVVIRENYSADSR